MDTVNVLDTDTDMLLIENVDVTEFDVRDDESRCERRFLTQVFQIYWSFPSFALFFKLSVHTWSKDSHGIYLQIYHRGIGCSCSEL